MPAARTATTPLEDGWHDYRELARLPKKDTDAVRRARMAYYAGASHLLAVITECVDLDLWLLELLVAELEVFVADRHAELEP